MLIPNLYRYAQLVKPSNNLIVSTQCHLQYWIHPPWRQTSRHASITKFTYAVVDSFRSSIRVDWPPNSFTKVYERF